MLITRIILKNWRNFRQVDAPFRERTYLLGPNAAGKSNLLGNRDFVSNAIFCAWDQAKLIEYLGQ
jgi:predicted ATPase